ncbi:MAG: hypothetical protein AAF725_24925 [Acidobacteriota bacterium]
MAIAHPADAQTEELLRWSQAWQRAGDSGPWVAISRDGHARLHRPDFFRDPGAFELRLDPEEITALAHDVSLLESFDAREIRRRVEDQKRDRAERSQGTRSLSGPAPSRFKTPSREIVWRSPGSDAGLLGDDDAAAQLERLARLEKRLLELLSDPRRRPLEAP